MDNKVPQPLRHQRKTTTARTGHGGGLPSTVPGAISRGSVRLHSRRPTAPRTPTRPRSRCPPRLPAVKKTCMPRVSIGQQLQLIPTDIVWKQARKPSIGPAKPGLSVSIVCLPDSNNIGETSTAHLGCGYVPVVCPFILARRGWFHLEMYSYLHHRHFTIPSSSKNKAQPQLSIRTALNQMYVTAALCRSPGIASTCLGMPHQVKAEQARVVTVERIGRRSLGTRHRCSTKLRHPGRPGGLTRFRCLETATNRHGTAGPCALPRPGGILHGGAWERCLPDRRHSFPISSPYCPHAVSMFSPGPLIVPQLHESANPEPLVMACSHPHIPTNCPRTRPESESIAWDNAAVIPDSGHWCD
jgi:hypothetical protein